MHAPQPSRSLRARRLLAGAVSAALAAGGAVWLAPPGHATGRAEDAGTAEATVADPAAYVDTRIGSANRGTTFPGAVRPFGMLSWSPEGSRNGDATRTATPGGYQYDMKTMRGFSLTHLSGTGCAGASGDIPFFPHAGTVDTSPSADTTDAKYAAGFSHQEETARPGYYRVKLASGVGVELTSTPRTGAGRFTYPTGSPATMLVRTSDSELGSTGAQVTVDPAARTISGSVTSGNFCGYIGGTSGTNGAVNRRPYYTLYFTAEFDTAFAATGSWVDGAVTPGATSARGGTTIGPDGWRPRGKGSGAYVTFDTARGTTVDVRVGISYVSPANARLNLRTENPPGTTFDEIRRASHRAWNASLGRIRIGGGTEEQRTTFYTALYHALLHPNLYSDVNGEYRGFGDTVAEQRTQRVRRGQGAQYANFSGWDVYRAQVQLLAWLEPGIAADVATSLLNQAEQNGGVWDRWTHNSGATHIMVGDPSTVTLAGMYAFGARGFPARQALRSLVRAARVPTGLDRSRRGWAVAVVGQRPSLDTYLKHGYYPVGCNAWACANETLEMSAADFGIAALADRLGERKLHREFVRRSQSWQNQFNPRATAHGGYFQDRTAGGAWTEDFDPASAAGFVEGTAAVYAWLVQHNPAGLIDAMGGRAAFTGRLDRHFKDPQGNWRLIGDWDHNIYANMDNEPSIHVPYLYNYAGAPWKTQETVRQTVDTLWKAAPGGIPGNDDLGTMSAWYVFSALGGFPQNPSRAELVVGSPLFPYAEVRPNGGKPVRFVAAGTSAAAKYVTGLAVDGVERTRSYLPESLVRRGGTVRFTMSATPDTRWGSAPADAPPSWREGEKPYQTSVAADLVGLAPGGRDTVALRADRLTRGGHPVRFSVSPPRGLTATPAAGTVTVDARTGRGDAVVTIAASPRARLGYHTVPVRFTSGGREVGRAAVTVVVAARGSLVARYTRTGIGDDGKANADFDGDHAYYSRQDLAAKGVVQGRRTAVPGTDLTFELPRVPAGRPDHLAARGQTLDLSAVPADTTKLSFVGSALGDAAGGQATIRYTDGTAQQVPLEFGDWTLGGDAAGTPRFGNLGVARCDYRNLDIGRETAKPWLFATAPVTLRAGTRVAGVTLPVKPNLRLFAVADDGTRRG
jgi:predicted alpha-1,2-mannosidase